MLLDLSPLRRHREYRLLYIGQSVSLIGSMMTQVAVPYQVFELSRSSLLVGLLGTAQLVPLLLFVRPPRSVGWGLLAAYGLAQARKGALSEADDFLTDKQQKMPKSAAILAAVSLKLHPDFATAIREMTRIGQVFHPEPQHAMTYDALYAQVYRRMYERLQPLYKSIQDITGYPARH